MKIMSISDIAISTIENEDKIKLMILREKWRELFSDDKLDIEAKNFYVEKGIIEDENNVNK